ncbi:unnamed protein product [Ectocarpus sp. CCAP 1310/34]|nr:unnamed protein product [Ectocarpus sp. CCAP 1310/34]
MASTRDARCVLLVAKDTVSKPAARLIFFRSTEKEKRWVGQETMHCLSNSKLLAMRGGSGAPATRTEDCWKKGGPTTRRQPVGFRLPREDFSCLANKKKPRKRGG